MNRHAHAIYPRIGLQSALPGWRQEGLLRLLEQRARDGNPGIGVLRHADAGYALAMERAESTGLAATVARGLP